MGACQVTFEDLLEFYDGDNVYERKLEQEAAFLEEAKANAGSLTNEQVRGAR